MIRIRVKEIARAKGIPISKLARKADLDNRTVYRLVNDPYAEFSSVTLARLAEALEVSVKDLIEDVPGSEQDKPEPEQDILSK